MITRLLLFHQLRKGQQSTKRAHNTVTLKAGEERARSVYMLLGRMREQGALKESQEVWNALLKVMGIKLK